MSTTLQQVILNALRKAATPDGETPVFATPEEARDAYIALVMAELFPGAPVAAKPKTKKSKKAAAESPVVAAPVEEVVVAEAAPVEAAPVEAAPVKVKSPKTKAKKAAEKAAEAPLPESPAAVAAPAESPKKKRAPMTEEAKAAMKAKREATLAAKKQVGEVAVGEPTIAKEPNLKKLDGSWKRPLTATAKAQGKEVTKEMEADLLSYVNRLTKEELDAKKAKEHVADFLAPQTASNAAASETVPTDLDIVEFNGQDYFVNPKTKRVYEGVGARDDDTGAYENYEGRGWVGMAEFEGMTLE
jgi:hypothetical protein